MTQAEYTDSALMKVSQRAFADEAVCVAELLAIVQKSVHNHATARALALAHVEALRAQKKFSPLELFQHEYGLDSQEGIMLMCLAEALLRIPDSATASALIHDKIGSGEWDRHLGFGRPWMVNLGSYGLELAEKVISRDRLQHSAGEFIGSLIHKLGEPVVRGALKHAMKLMGNAFVMGESIEQAQNTATKRDGKTFFSYDMLGEGARSAEQAAHHFAHYMHATRALAGQKGHNLFVRDGISIKLSALHQRFELRKWRLLQRELLPKLVELLVAAKEGGIMVTIDAEEATRLDVSLLVFAQLLEAPELAGYEGLGLAVQAYQKRAPYVIDYVAALAKKAGKRVPLRLVKGAYWDSEIKRAQVEGLPSFPVFTCKEHTDLSYLACAVKLLAEPDVFYPQFATHNALTIASILQLAGDAQFEFQRLHGMGDALYEQVLATIPHSCRVYAPVGPAQSLLSYLIRRILENGANSSFVHGVYDAPIEQLLADPVAYSAQSAGAPAAAIAAPHALYAPRVNSTGYDLGNAAMLAAWEKRVRTTPVHPTSPQESGIEHCDAAFARAQKAFIRWRETPAIERATCLERAADLFEEHEAELVCLCMREGRKTLADSISELREAVDFCRYYAGQARELFTPTALPGSTGERNVLSLHPRGVMVAISPWNFPLAIFTGQVAAALVTGNTVLAKPAGQTPRIAAYAVSLLHEAGVPHDVLQLLHGSGRTLGGALVADNRTAGVLFTGSTGVAWDIQRALAARNAPITPLIAETGGQNCMVVDSSALLEQTVDDMVLSAFGSAGQRCSALRVAFVQEDIADELLRLLAGAVASLELGDTQDVAVDVGPVIDKNAYMSLSQHIGQMKQKGRFVAAATLPDDASARHFLAPHVFEIPHISVLEGEVFGPILHVVRYGADKLDDVVAQVNSTGFGLTFGIQSRIDEKIAYLIKHVSAGNIYVNRSMIGAVVGLQPFGGNGLSGTGPKAGGPHYLARLCMEQTISTNTAAVGGNLELLA